MTPSSPSTTQLPLGDFKPADEWQTHVNSVFYGIQGPGIHRHFQTYVSLDHRLAQALADRFYREAQNLGGEQPLIILEWGVGNGNLAACFLDHVRSLDTAHRVYPRLRYVLCDYSRAILQGALAHPGLRQHARVTAVQADAEHLECFRPASVLQIHANEIWDDLATKVLLKHNGDLLEEYLQPTLDPGLAASLPFDELRDRFNARDLAGLAALPPFLQHIQWRHEYQRVLIDDWPHAGTLLAHMERVEDGIPVPINVGAFRTLERARALLDPNGLGFTGFDYGMFSMEEVNLPGRPYFNIYGGQYTSMINFEILCAVGTEAVGWRTAERERQHEFVGKHLGDRVLSVLEVVQTHPGIGKMPPWDRDILMLDTLHALNGAYRCPYKRKLEYPVTADTPKKQKQRIEELARNLSAVGVPDTVAYVTEHETFTVIKKLKQLGYEETVLKKTFRNPRQPIAFAGVRFR
jgi:hypothetical protein